MDWWLSELVPTGALGSTTMKLSKPILWMTRIVALMIVSGGIYLLTLEPRPEAIATVAKNTMPRYQAGEL